MLAETIAPNIDKKSSIFLTLASWIRRRLGVAERKSRILYRASPSIRFAQSRL